MAEITVSLNRAHKVVERLTRHIDEISSTLAEAIGPFPVMTLHEKVEASYQAHVGQAVELLERIASLTDVLASVRVAIANKNAETKLNSLLVKAAVYRRFITDGKTALVSGNLRRSSSLRVLSFEELTSYFEMAKEAKEIPKVGILEKDSPALNKLNEQIRHYERMLNSTMDEINDINVGNKVTLTIPDDLVEVVS